MRTTLPTTAPRRVSGTVEVAEWGRALLSLAFVLLVPLLIIGTSLRGLVTDQSFMMSGFRDNNVAARTGLDEAQLQRVADAFVAYFQAPPGEIQLQVVAFGRPRALFNEREVAHMQDVQALVQWFLRLQIVAAAVVVARVAVAVAFDRAPGPVGREMVWSTAFMIGLVLVVAVLSVIDFDALWTRFHQIAFRNGLWLLDPTSDYLIMLFPPAFWLTATIRMATSVALQTLLVALIGLGLMFSPRLLAGRSS